MLCRWCAGNGWLHCQCCIICIVSNYGGSVVKYTYRIHCVRLLSFPSHEIRPTNDQFPSQPSSLQHFPFGRALSQWSELTQSSPPYMPISVGWEGWKGKMKLGYLLSHVWGLHSWWWGWMHPAEWRCHSSYFGLLYLYYFRHTSQLTTRLYHGKISGSWGDSSLLLLLEGVQISYYVTDSQNTKQV